MARRKNKTTKRTNNKRRKGALALFMPWMQRFGLILGSAVFVLWAGTWLWLNGSVHAAMQWGHEQMLEITADAGFRVENILVEGRVNSDPDIILALINIQKGEPLFAFEPHEAQKQLQKISWIKAIGVERRWPDTIYINLTERRPLVLWQKGKILQLLDEEGEVIATEGLTRFKNLIVVNGKGAPAQASNLIAHIEAAPFLKARIQNARWIGARRWDIYLKNGIVIKAPETGLKNALIRLEAIQKESAILDKDILGIDLREEDRIAVQTRPGMVQDYQAGLKTQIRNKTKSKTGNNI